MFGWLGRWWRKRQRRSDLEILWPILKKDASSVYVARSAFRTHCLSDPCWTKDLGHLEIEEIIGRLT